MKKYIFIALMFICSITIAQENYKGQISLLLNEEKIELPINVVSLRKENKVLISIRAERNTEDIQQLISLEWEFKKLSTDDKDLSMYDAFLINNDLTFTFAVLHSIIDQVFQCYGHKFIVGFDL